MHNVTSLTNTTLSDEHREYVQSLARILRLFASSMRYGQNAIALAGILCNIFVIHRLYRIIKERPYLNPAYYLLAMCCADVFCLTFLVTYAHAAALIFESTPDVFHICFCKISMFSIHVASAFGMWCWMALSLHRYVAVFYPASFRHRVWYVRPICSLCVVLFISFVIETWLPLATTAIGKLPRRDCVENTMSRTFTSSMQIGELIVTFVVPVVGLIYFDIAVRTFQKRRYSESKQEAIEYTMTQSSMKETNVDKHLNPTVTTPTSARKNIAKLWPPSQTDNRHSVPLPSLSVTPSINDNVHSSVQDVVQLQPQTDHLASPTVSRNSFETHSTMNRARRTRRSFFALKRYIKLTAFDLLLNMPNTIMRFMHVFGWLDPPGPLPQHTVWWISSTVFTSVTYVLYYTQFSINILFLWVLYREQIVSKNRQHSTIL